MPRLKAGLPIGHKGHVPRGPPKFRGPQIPKMSMWFITLINVDAIFSVDKNTSCLCPFNINIKGGIKGVFTPQAGKISQNLGIWAQKFSPAALTSGGWGFAPHPASCLSRQKCQSEHYFTKFKHMSPKIFACCANFQRLGRPNYILFLGRARPKTGSKVALNCVL